LAGDRSELAVTLDEAFIYMKNVNGHGRNYYVAKDKDVRDYWVYEREKSYSKSFKVIGVITGTGPLPLFQVPTNVKINAEYYVK